MIKFLSLIGLGKNKKNKDKSTPVRRRRLALEALENRELLSVSPFDIDIPKEPMIMSPDFVETTLISLQDIGDTVVGSLGADSLVASLENVNQLSQAEFNTIRTRYADLNLKTSVGDYHVIEIAASQLSEVALRDAITEATSNGLDNLIVVRTTATQNKITLSGTALSIGSGKVAIVSQGPEKLTIDADMRSQVFFILGNETNVALGGLTITKRQYL